MSSTFTNSMFASLKETLNKPQESSYKDILKFEAGKTYIVRLVPIIKDPASSIYHYYHYSWKSFSTGQFVSFLSPQTFGERCPIAEESYKIYKKGSPEEKQKGRALYRKENWLVNVYVISDPTNPENEGTVKIMRFGNQLNKIIMSAIDGDDAEEFGARIFDLSENGCNLRVKCEKKTEKGKSDVYVEYTASRFLSPSPLEGVSDPKEVLESVYDLTQIFPIKTNDELKKALQEHYYADEITDGNEGGSSTERAQKPSSKSTTTTRVSINEDGDIDEDAIPSEYMDKSSEKASTPSKPQEDTKKVSSIVEDEALKDLLRGLDD